MERYPGNHIIQTEVTMKKMIAVVLLLILAAGMAYGQDKQYRDNNLGLVFLFSGLSNTMLINYNGGFGAKFNMGAFAIRPVLIFASVATRGAEPDPNPAPAWNPDETTMSVFGFGASFLFNLTSGRIVPYIGAGALVEFGSTKTTPGYVDGFDPDIPSSSQFGLAAHMLIGFEFFIVKNISFSGEYRFGYGMTSMTDKYDFHDPTIDDMKSTSKASAFGIISSGFAILTVYII